MIDPSADTEYRRLEKIISGYRLSQIIYVFAKLEIASVLANGPVSLISIVKKTNTNSELLEQILRATVLLGIVRENAGNVFELTTSGKWFLPTTTNSLHYRAIMNGEEQYFSWGKILDTVRTGNPSFNSLYGDTYFSYLSKHPDTDTIFNHALSSSVEVRAKAILELYDFSGHQVIVDVGGGQGYLLRSILSVYKSSKGILIDRTSAIDENKNFVLDPTLIDRLSVFPGNFLDKVPPLGDLYILSRVLPDWDDNHAFVILKNIKCTLPINGRILIIGRLLPESPDRLSDHVMYLHLATLTGGKERTWLGYSSLLATLQLRIINTYYDEKSRISILECGHDQNNS
jgi:predicted transcriptional regulator